MSVKSQTTLFSQIDIFVFWQFLFISVFPTFLEFFFINLKSSKSPIKHSRNNQTIECDQRFNEMVFVNGREWDPIYHHKSIEKYQFAERFCCISPRLGTILILIRIWPQLMALLANRPTDCSLHSMLLIILSGYYASLC